MDFTAFDHLSLNFIEAFFPSFFSLLRLFPSPLGRGMATFANYRSNTLR